MQLTQFLSQGDHTFDKQCALGAIKYAIAMEIKLHYHCFYLNWRVGSEWSNRMMAENLLSLRCRSNLNLQQCVPHRQPAKQKPHQFGTTNKVSRHY